jgi:hypothetical protein
MNGPRGGSRHSLANGRHMSVAGRRELVDPPSVGSRIEANGEEFTNCGFRSMVWAEAQASRTGRALVACVVDRNHTSAASVLREALTDRLTACALALRRICLESPRGSDRPSLQTPSSHDRRGTATGIP